MTSTQQERTMDWKLELVVVPVSDVDRAKRFYAEQLGFVVDVDDRPTEGFRVVQLTPPGSACSISIGQGLTEAVPGTLQGMQLCVGDIDAAHAQLVERGVDVTPIRHVDREQGGWADGKGGVYNSFIFFKDPDGNGWAIQESPLLGGAGAES
jgi:catechol 2,3-dioxygenase-like lactoylglutathione lyase family enzyme